MEIKIAPSDDYTQDEKKKMIKVFKEHGLNARVGGGCIRESAGALPPLMHVFIYIGASAFVTGFFAAAGHDAWKKLIECMKNLKNIHKNDQEPHLLIHFKDDEGLDVIAYLPGDREEIEKALVALPNYLSKSDRAASIWFTNDEWGTAEYHRENGNI